MHFQRFTSEQIGGRTIHISVQFWRVLYSISIVQYFVTAAHLDSHNPCHCHAFSTRRDGKAVFVDRYMSGKVLYGRWTGSENSTLTVSRPVSTSRPTTYMSHFSSLWLSLPQMIRTSYFPKHPNISTPFTRSFRAVLTSFGMARPLNEGFLFSEPLKYPLPIQLYANKKSKAWAAFLSLMIDIEHMPIIIIKFVSLIFLFSTPPSYIRLHVVMITCITNPFSWLLFRTQLEVNVWYCNSSSRYLGIYFLSFLSKKNPPSFPYPHYLYT